MNKEELNNLSNKYHDAVCEYFEKNGDDEHLATEIIGKIMWLEHFARKNGINLDR